MGNEKQTMTFAQIPEDACRDSWAAWLAKSEENQSLPALTDSEFTRKLKLDNLVGGMSPDQLQALHGLKQEVLYRLATNEGDNLDLDSLVKDIEYVISAQTVCTARAATT